MAKVSASILSADFSKLKDEIKEVEKAGVDFIHLDVMDGVFVPNITFGPFMAELVKRFTALPIDAHLMIIDPIKYVQEFSKAGCEYIIFHPEAKSPIEETIERIREAGSSPGLAINPETPLETIEGYLGKIDWVLLMSVHPGFAGQRFIQDVIPKIRKLRSIKGRRRLSFTISVDGGINGRTANLVREAGAEVVVTASYLFNADHRERIVELLKAPL